ncbi:MAG: conjugative transfer signal peptidase TraF [Balneolaceae bacterium]|nr:conjugative transfer signal peptidase TraF [Balneolaceae bacterium]
MMRGTLAFNLSESIPKGVYLQSIIENFERGDLVLFYSEKADKLGVHRGYKRSGALLGKRIVALPGDTIKLGHIVCINGRVVGEPVLTKDTAGRSLTPFTYQGVVPKGQLFVLGETENSFDSRYYGLIRKEEVTRKLKPLFTWR